MPRPTSERWWVASWTAWRRIHAASTTCVAGAGGAPPRRVAGPGARRPCRGGAGRWRRSASRPSASGSGRRVGRVGAPRASSRSSTVRMASSSRPMLATTSALWLRYSAADHTPAPAASLEHVGRRCPRSSAPTSVPAPAACRACRGRSYCAPSNRHASQVSTGTGIRPSCRVAAPDRAAGSGQVVVVVVGRVAGGRGRARSGTGSGTIRSERRPASSASEITSRSGSPTRPATRAASSCSTFTRPGLTFTRTGKPATSTVSVCAGRRPAVDGGAAHAERAGLAGEHLGDLAR